jgi:hypothetical protein
MLPYPAPLYIQLSTAAAELAKRDLQLNLAEFRKYNAARKFRVAIRAVVAANKFNSLATMLKEMGTDLDDGAGTAEDSGSGKVDSASTPRDAPNRV